MSERQPNRPPILEPQQTSHEGGNGSPGLPRTVHESSKPPPEGFAHGGSERTSVQPSVVENCIVRDLRPSSERVDEMFAQGLITEEQAAQQKKEALTTERVILLGERISDLRRQFFPIDNGLSTQEKQRLRAEYKEFTQRAPPSPQRALGKHVMLFSAPVRTWAA
jgi:hypothetical protein